MALTTRVWSAGKLLLLVAALVLTYVVFAAASMRVAIRAREVFVPSLTGQSVNQATTALGRSRPDAQGRRDPAPRSEGPSRADPDPGSACRASAPGASAASRSGSAPGRGPASSRRSSARSERTAQLQHPAGRPRAGRGLRDPVGRLPRRRRRLADAAAASARADGCRCWSTAASAAATLRDARPDRRERRPAPPTCCGRAGSAPRWSAITRIRACPRASCCGRTRRPASRLRRGSRSLSRSAADRWPSRSRRPSSPPTSASCASSSPCSRQGGADLIHVDVMDGHFVPNLTMGPVVVEAIRRATRLPLDVHLMITDPDRYLQAFVDAGGSRLTVHVEAAAASAPHDSGDQEARGRRPAWRSTRRRRSAPLEEIAPRSGSRAGDVGEPGLLGSDFHPAQRV